MISVVDERLGHSAATTKVDKEPAVRSLHEDVLRRAGADQGYGATAFRIASELWRQSIVWS